MATTAGPTDDELRAMCNRLLQNWRDAYGEPAVFCPTAEADAGDVARALLARLGAGDDRPRGPRYIAYCTARQFYVCSTLAEALDWRARAGATVYEPLGMSAAERIAAEPVDDQP